MIHGADYRACGPLFALFSGVRGIRILRSSEGVRT
jgi:hypothetical protein